MAATYRDTVISTVNMLKSDRLGLYGIKLEEKKDFLTLKAFNKYFLDFNKYFRFWFKVFIKKTVHIKNG